MNQIVIDYQRGATAMQDRFPCQVTGHWPLTPAIGFLHRVQCLLSVPDNEWRESRDDGKFVAEFVDGVFKWSTDPSIPFDCLVGVLEIVKQSLVAAKMQQEVAAQQQAAQRRVGLYDAHGVPMRRGGPGGAG